MCLSRRSILLLPLAISCKKAPSPTVFIDPALATLVPSDTNFLAGIRMQQLQSTPVYRKYIAQAGIPSLERFAKRTGLTDMNDLWEMLITSDPRGVAVMMRGKFAEMGMEPRVNREGAQRFGYGGFTLLGDDRYAVAFLNPSTALAGTLPQLRYLIDHRNETTGIPKPLQSRISQISSDHQFWFCGGAKALAGAAGFGTGPWEDLLRSTAYISGGADVRSGIRLHVVAETDSNEEANRLRDSMRGLVGLARLGATGKRPELLRIADAVRIESDGRNAKLQLEVGPDLLDEVMRLSGPFTGS